MIKRLEQIKEYLVLAIVFLFPVVFAGVFIDPIGPVKLIVLFSLIGLFLIVFVIHAYVSRKMGITAGKFDLPIFLIVGAYLLSAFFMTPNKTEAFFIPGNASLVLGAGIVYFLIGTIVNKNKVKVALVTSSCLISLFVFMNFLGVFEKIPFLAGFVKQIGFNPTGDFMTGAIFLIATIPFAIFFLVRENNIARKLVFAFCLVIILVASGISVFVLATSNKKVAPLLPTFETSWAVAIDSIRENPVLGIGPGNYLTAFDRFRPANYNLTNLWNTRFTAGRDWYLSVSTETGLLGVIALVVLLISIFKFANKNIDTVSFSVLVGILIVLLFLPATPVALFLLFVILGINAQSSTKTISIDGHNIQSARLILCLAVIGGVLYFGFQARQVVLAEVNFKEAIDALSAGNGKKTYDKLQQAINLNPYVDRYHAYYAQVNYAIAKSVSTSVKDPKDLTDEQKNLILQLIQQAIREGQNTVSLNPSRASDWQVLASIYQAVIPYAKQADQFAIQTYTQTIDLDPTDPNLRIALGGLYFSLGQYDNAIDTFKFAVLAKPDLANAYYNLSAAYAAKNDFKNAIAAMNQVLSLVDKNSNDYKTAQDGLSTLQKKQSDLQEANTSGTLQSPQKAQAPAVSPQLSLPEEASPPATPKL